MKISIIIPTLNAGKNLRGLLKELAKQTLQPDEIIIVDSCSKDDTRSVAESNGAKVIQISGDAFDHGETRTLGAKESKGDILIFMTQDVILADDDAIESLIQCIRRDDSIAAAYGRQLPRTDASLFSSHLRYFNYPGISFKRGFEDREQYGLRAVFFSNSFSAYKRAVLEKAGWFKENIIMGEDTCAAAKIQLEGYKIAYVADAVVYHSHNYSIIQEFMRYFDIGVFHKHQEWLIDTYGKVQGEGVRFVKSELVYLLRKRKILRIPESILRNGMKYVGYFMGKQYRRLPKGFIKRMSMHPQWWNNRS